MNKHNATVWDRQAKKKFANQNVNENESKFGYWMANTFWYDRKRDNKMGMYILTWSGYKQIWSDQITINSVEIFVEQCTCGVLFKIHAVVKKKDTIHRNRNRNQQPVMAGKSQFLLL